MYTARNSHKWSGIVMNYKSMLAGSGGGTGEAEREQRARGPEPVPMLTGSDPVAPRGRGGEEVGRGGGLYGLRLDDHGGGKYACSCLDGLLEFGRAASHDELVEKAQIPV